MIRITRAQLSFRGFGGGSDRAAAITRRALGQLAQDPAGGLLAARPRVQLTVRVPHNASDAAISDRIHAALRRLGGLRR